MFLQYGYGHDTTAPAPFRPTDLRTGDVVVDAVIAHLFARGYALRDMNMPFPAVVMGFCNDETGEIAQIIYTDAGKTVWLPDGTKIDGNTIVTGKVGAPESDLARQPVAQYWAAIQADAHIQAEAQNTPQTKHTSPETPRPR